MIIPNCPRRVITLKGRFLVALLLAWLCTSAHALSLQTYDIEYQTKARGFNIKTISKLEKTDGMFKLSLIASTMMMQTSEVSTFSVNEKGTFSLHSLTYQRKILGNNKFQKTDFYPKKKTAIYQPEGETAEKIALPGEIYDTLNYQEKLRLNLILSQGKTSALSFKVLEKNRIREYNFRITGSEWLPTKQGYLETIKIERVRDNSTKKTTTWLAKKWDYAVVKVQHKKEGEPEYLLTMMKGTVGNKDIRGLEKLPVTTK